MLSTWAISISLIVVGTACGTQTQTGGAGAAKVAGLSPSPSTSAVAAATRPRGSTTGKWTFDADPVGGLPAGAQAFSGQWAVRAEPDAPSPPNALCQTGNADFPAISLDSGPYADLTFVTRFKAISGKQDQAAGLIFRVQDRDNYYILRANALEDNVIFFTYLGARRSQLKGADARVTPNAWHELRAEVRGNVFRAFLDGTAVADASDERYKSGGVGIWTKADSVTCFDDVVVTSD